MAILDAITTATPQSVYMFPAPINTGGAPARPNPKDVFHLQYWPPSLSEDYQVAYTEHIIPGGSHPLYQWFGGLGRTISFEAAFTSEINTTRNVFSGGSTVAGASFGSVLFPSHQFTVDIAAALSRLRSYMLPDYPQGGAQGLTKPPQILTLVFPGTKLNGSDDMINVILRSAPIIYEAWFPDGQPRVAVANLTFNEVVQQPTGSNTGRGSGSNVKFIGRGRFSKAAENYKVRGLADRAYVG